MPDGAKLACFDDRLTLPIGMFHNTEGPRGRRLFAYAGAGLPAAGLSIDSPLYRRAVRRFLAEHLDHDVRLLGEDSPAWESVPPAVFDTFRNIGWDDFDDDPPLTEYADGTWRPAHRWTDRPATPPVPGRAGLACFDEELWLPLDFSGSPGTDRAVFRFVVEHVYHDVHLLGAPPSRPVTTIDPAAYADGA